MILLLDTHLLLWAVDDPARLSSDARAFLDDPSFSLMFSAASIWETAIKSALGKPDFHVKPDRLRDGLKQNGYDELTIKSAHAVAVTQLPTIHKDPFDRILIAQASIEKITLLTADSTVANYPGPIRMV